MEELRFDPEKHEYWYGKVRVPSVTEIIDDLGLIAPDVKKFYSEFAASRGKALHKATELYDKGILDETTVDDRIKGYLEAYKKFVSMYTPVWTHIECRVFNPELFYAGILDRYGKIKKDSSHTLMDLKTGSPNKSHGIQLGLYYLAFLYHKGDYYIPRSVPHSLYNLYLKKDGSFKPERDLVFCKEPTIFQIAEGAVRLYHWKHSK